MSRPEHNGTIYDRTHSMILTRLSGTACLAEVDRWKESLEAALTEIPTDGHFRILVDLFGFKAADFNTHKHFRTIIPLTMAQYGWKVGYVDLFEGHADAISYHTTRGIQCTAAAHVHHDATKIDLYQCRFGTQQEGFFTDTEQALSWLQER